MIQEASSFDHAAEYQLIGWVLTDNKIFPEISHLDDSIFHYGFHAEIWRAMKDLSAKGDAISPFTLKPLLQGDTPENEPILSYLGKAAYSSALMFKPLEAVDYLLSMAKKRDFQAVCNSLDHNGDLSGNIARLSKAIEIAESDSDNGEFFDNLQISDQILKDLSNKKKPYPTGLAKLDTCMDGGLYEGKAYGFAARKKVGKTALAATISANLNASGVKHLFICGEMSPKEIHQRVLARHAEIFPTAFRTDYGKSENCEKKITEAIKAAPRNTLYKNAPGLTFEALRQICTLAVEKHKVRGIILDYWQLVGGKDGRKSTAEHLDEVAQWIADFGRSHGVWSITMAQLNQEDNTRGGEGIRLAMDQLYQLHRDNLTQPEAWIEMMETRYTPWLNIGSKEIPGLLMNEKGPFFEEFKF